MDRFMSSKQKSFEALMTELEELITSVEAGSMPLEKMVEQLEHGTKLVQNCQEKLNALNSRVEMLFKDDVLLPQKHPKLLAFQVHLFLKSQANYLLYHLIRNVQ